MWMERLDVSKHSVGVAAWLVFQNPDHQIFCSSTKEEIAFGPTALGLDAATVFPNVSAEMMTLFDLHRGMRMFRRPRSATTNDVRWHCLR